MPDSTVLVSGPGLCRARRCYFVLRGQRELRTVKACPFHTLVPGAARWGDGGIFNQGPSTISLTVPPPPTER